MGEGQYFKLDADIDLSTVCGKSIDGEEVSWTPIGLLSDKAFRGNFDGDNHTISNLYINAPDSSGQGLFGYVINASIENLNLVGGNVIGKDDVGGVVGSTGFLTFNNISYSGSVSGLKYVGGLVGGTEFFAASKLSHSGNVIGNGFVGGLVGVAEYAFINNISHSGSVSGNIYVGGVVGYVYNIDVSNSINSGNVNGYESVGGLIGMVYEATISNSINNGNVSGSYDYGCIVGYDDGSVLTIKHTYYDKQMCSANNSYGEGKLTTEMIGDKLSSFLGTESFVYADSLYPRLKGFENTNAAIAFATPLLLPVINDSVYQTIDSVSSWFIVGNHKNVAWAASPSENVAIVDSIYTPIKIGELDLSASIDGVIYKTIKLNVIKPVPVLTWSVADYTYGEAFKDKMTASVLDLEGSFTYKNGENVISDTTILNAGDYTLSVTFIPEDTTYASVFRTVTVLIEKVTPVITWKTPGSITTSTKLSSTQLNAEADVKGTFVYTPASGTKLKEGTQTLKVVFTPSDTSNYVIVEKSVNIKVNATTGIVQVLQNNFTLYPNITTTGFYIDLGNSPSAIHIYDHQGRIMDMVHVNGRQFIDISRYAQGLYIVRTTKGKTWKVMKR